MRRDGVAYVRLGRLLQPVEVLGRDEREGEALLASMRLDAARSVGHYTMTAGTRRRARVEAVLVIAGLPPTIFGLLHVVSGVYDDLDDDAALVRSPGLP